MKISSYSFNLIIQVCLTINVSPSDYFKLGKHSMSQLATSDKATHCIWKSWKEATGAKVNYTRKFLKWEILHVFVRNYRDRVKWLATRWNPGENRSGVIKSEINRQSDQTLPPRPNQKAYMYSRSNPWEISALPTNMMLLTVCSGSCQSCSRSWCC